MRSVPLRAVSRIDRRGIHAWRVYIKRRGQDHVWLFHDHEYDNRARARRAAEAWHFHMLERLSPPLCTSSDDVRNTTGVVGVSLMRLERKKGKVYLAYRAVWPLTDGRYKKRAFSVTKHGKQTAFDLAVQARKQGLAQLKEKLRHRVDLEINKQRRGTHRR